MEINMKKLEGEYKSLLAAETTATSTKQLFAVLSINADAYSSYFDVTYALFQSGKLKTTKRFGSLSRAIRYFNSVETNIV